MVAHISFRCFAVTALSACPLIGGAACLEAESRGPLTVLAFGDSTTAPREVEGASLTVYADILREELPAGDAGFTVINAGVRGNTTADAAERFAKDVLSHAADVVIIQFGANDAMVDVWKDPPARQPRVTIQAYEEHLRTFVRTLRDRGVKVVLMTPSPFRWTPGLRKRYGRQPYQPDDPDGINVLLQTYAATVRRIAKEEGVVLVDVYEAFSAYGRVAGQSVDDLLLDGIHPNEAGHRLVADRLLEALGKMNLESSAVGRFDNQGRPPHESPHGARNGLKASSLGIRGTIAGRPYDSDSSRLWLLAFTNRGSHHA